LARVAPGPQGATTAGLCGHPPGHARPLGKSHSETLYAPGQDREVAKRCPGSSLVTQAGKEPEEPPAPIYLNLQELREEAAAAAAAAAAASSSSAPEEAPSSPWDWETYRDAESGLLFYYNPGTGETTWDCPFGQAEDA
ncbi:RHG27 protein, partial [Psilopogon haemacephalus]|nr:RHG27 protein [Psilopogon haemacephalus]